MEWSPHRLTVELAVTGPAVRIPNWERIGKRDLIRNFIVVLVHLKMVVQQTLQVKNYIIICTVSQCFISLRFTVKLQ